VSETTYEHLARRSTDADLVRLLAEHRDAMDRAQSQMGMHAAIYMAIRAEQERRRHSPTSDANRDDASVGGAL
jgi:hypothetical protein